MDERFLRPLELLPNPVYRFYEGGELLGRFRGDHLPRDGDFPEDWVGSVTRATNPPEHSRSGEGLSHVQVDGLDVSLAELLLDDAAAVAGSELVERFGPTIGVLVKLLDAGCRLPIHAHPTREFASRHLGSPFGKAEAWIVLETRAIAGAEPPGVRLGFRTALGMQHLLDLISEQRVAEMSAAMHFIPVTAGDVIYVPPGVPHSIGAGVFVMEVQEPTDFSIILEWQGFPIDPADADLGLGWQTISQTLDAGPISNERLRELQPSPLLIAEKGSSRLESLLGSLGDDTFAAHRLRVAGSADWPFAQAYSVAVVTEGAGRVSNRAGSLDVRQGSSVAVLAAAPPVTVQGTLTMVVFSGPGARAQA